MRLLTCTSVMAVFLATAALSQAPQPVQQNNSNTIWFENWTGLRNASIVISTPSGEMVTIFAESGTPVFELSGREVLDGIYRYELSAATEETVKIVNQIDSGRGDAAKDTAAVPFYMSGVFHVARGVIIQPEQIKEE